MYNPHPPPIQILSKMLPPKKTFFLWFFAYHIFNIGEGMGDRQKQKGEHRGGHEKLIRKSIGKKQKA